MASTARLDELKKKFDENPRRYFAPLANEHRKSGDLDQAIALCRAHLPQQPAHISGHIVLAQALFEAGSLDEAREIFHTALSLDPENLIALRYLGDIARDADDVETARGWYQRVLEVDPRNDEIVQLVRALDAPRPESIEPTEEPASAEPVAQAAPVEQAAPSAPTASDNNARFAPIESLELDEAIDSPPAPVEDFSASQAGGVDATIDAEAWTADAPTIELPAVGAGGVDPFDMDPAASADSLFDAHAAAPADDFFLTELTNAADRASEFDLAESGAVDPWASQTEAQAPTAGADASAPTFEEGSFYVEEAPTASTEPVAAESSSDAAAVDVSAIDDAAFELPEAPPHDAVAVSESSEIVASADEPAVAQELIAESVQETQSSGFEPTAPVEDLAERPTEEWHTQEPSAPQVAAQTNNDLGLEVMEFVPPSSEPVAPMMGIVADSDPLLGRTPELAQTSHGATPPSFVTETMAELYLQQGFRNEALAVYRELLARNPSDASLRERVEQIESGSMSSVGMANVSETVVESALKRQSARPAKSVRSFFASLAGRRAPAPPPHAPEQAYAADHVEAQADSSYAEEYVANEPAPSYEPGSYDAPTPVAETQPSMDTDAADRIAPMMSAAETLASFDPFADAGDPPLELPAEPLPAGPSDDVFGFDSFAAPNAEPVALQPEPAPESSPEPMPPFVAPDEPQAIADPRASGEPQASAEPRRTLEDLFPDTPVTPRAEAAAQTLATAFGRIEPQGRPTRAANSELSLDKVFRGAPEGAPPADGGFSFDQFFSDARPAAGGDVAAPTFAPPETGRSAGAAGDSHDIEQFTAWLEGLKKK